ncbi:MAG: hypothetical protein FJ149_03360 [Euryarchaeota archaeon]|nr:hypothetical protein [Euryarchaeota archaeon]
MTWRRARAAAALAAALLLAPAVLQLMPVAVGGSELYKTSAGDTSAELLVRVPPGYNDSVSFTLPSEALVQGARFDLSPSPVRMSTNLTVAGAGLLEGGTSDGLVLDGDLLRLADVPGSLGFSAWQGNPACGTAVVDRTLRLSLDAGAMYFSKNLRIHPTNQPQYDPALAVDSRGRVVIAWTDQGEYDFNIYLAATGEGGANFSRAVRVNDDLGSNKARQEAAEVAIGPGDRIYVAWTDNRSGNEDIYLSASTDGGATFSPNVRVDDGPPGTNASFPSLALSPSGRVAVAWEDTRAGDKDVRCALSDDGATFSPSVRLNNDGSGREQLRPRLAAGSDGRFHAVWYDNRSGDFDIYYARSGGSGFLPERRVDDTGDQGSFQALPAVAVGPDQTVHVVWHDRRYEGYRIMYSRSPDGIAFSANLPVSMVAGPGKDQFQPRVRLGADGTVHVAWHDRRNTYPDIFYANSTSGGKSFGPPVLVDDAPRDTLSYSPALGVDAQGWVHVAWWDNRTRQGAFGTNFQIFHSRGTIPYFPAGEFLSPPQDLGTVPAALAGADWSGDLPDNTTLGVELSTSPGAGGPWSDFFDISAAGAPDGPPAARYLRWRVSLSTKDPTATPALASLGLDYLSHPARGTLRSRHFILPHPLRTADVYLAEGRQGEGPASLGMELSPDNGTTWQSLRPGLPFEFSGTGRVLVYRLVLDGSPSSTPTLSSVFLDLGMESRPSDVSLLLGRSGVTAWNLPGALPDGNHSSPELRDDFNRLVQEARRALLPNATVRLNFTSATPGYLTVDNIRISYDRPPRILSRDPEVAPDVDEGGLLAFSVTAIDPDGDALSSRWLLDGIQVETGTMGFVYRPDHTESGVHNLTVSVSDGVLSASSTWLVRVIDVNRPPVIESSTPASRVRLHTGEPAHFEVRATDPDGNPLVYEWRLSGQPAGSSDRAFDLVAPDRPGTETLTVNVTDGIDSTGHTWVIDVERPQTVPPVDAPFPHVQLAAGAMLALAAVMAVVMFLRRRPGGHRGGRKRARL